MINQRKLQQFKYLIWIHDSIGISQKLFKLAKSLKSSEVLFVSLTRKTQLHFINRGFNCISLNQEIIKRLKTGLRLKKNKDISLKNIFIEKLIFSSKYGGGKYPRILSFTYSSKESQLYFFYSFWSDFLNDFNGKVMILNGMCLASFTLTIASKEQKKNIIFWENGFYPDSLFIDSVGVNSYSSIAFNNFFKKKNEPTKKLKNFEALFSEKDLKVLITLQVDNDINIKCSSPFFSFVDFIIFLRNIIKNKNKFKKVKIRSHPKYKVSSFIIKFLCNFDICKSNKNIYEELDASDILLTINSTTGFESILKNKSVVIFGNSIYSHSFERYSLSYLGKNLEIALFDPLNRKSILERKKFLTSISKASLFMEDGLENWKNKINYQYKKSSKLKPFMFNKQIQLHSFPFFENQFKKYLFLNNINLVILKLKKMKINFVKFFAKFKFNFKIK